MSEINKDEPTPAGNSDGAGQGNGLLKLDLNGPAQHLEPHDFKAVAWALEVRAARLMLVPFRLYSGGKWRLGAAGDYIVLGAGGEVAIVAGLDFPQLCKAA